jgi:hypothetical protein
MSEEPEFFSYSRDEFLDEFVHPDDRPALEEAHQKWYDGLEGLRSAMY